MTVQAEVLSRPSPPSGRGLGRAAVAVLRAPASTPLATGTVVLLVAVSLLLRTHPADVDDVVGWTSTNVHNLTRHPVAAMIASAFVVPGGPGSELVVVAAALAVLEYRIGIRRTALIVAAGHVLATLATEFGLDVGLALHWFPAADADRSDVGISYVMYTAVAAGVLLLPGRWRLVGVAGVAFVTVLPFALAPGLTSTGHLLSVAIGLAGMAWWRRRGARGQRRPSVLGLAPGPPPQPGPQPESGRARRPAGLAGGRPAGGGPARDRRAGPATSLIARHPA